MSDKTKTKTAAGEAEVKVQVEVIGNEPLTVGKALCGRGARPWLLVSKAKALAELGRVKILGV